ncbi:alpha/beta fold hydrolase [Gimibacter soli]|uniref:Alpha/beta hydrolase n=1 Tax=Gimibacter soli TaxID=3024400 RepID=A0AAF0BLL3_9PROT|nr:alpha/beta hydrolase [Gimibacter soli]WCL53281.1 alpha/beta hydrolase [Gimibacter soli]
MLKQTYTAANVPTEFVESRGRTLAYRSIGAGSPLILCVRFRGVMDVWDPAFLDALATRFRVITFDYTGLGQSTGHATYDRVSMAEDAIDLADALGIDTFAIGGWSLGGIAAQVAAKRHPGRISHMILIGTTPPGKVAHGPEPVFFERALKPVNDLDDETVLFFEPESEKSRKATKASHDRINARTADRSPPIPQETFMRMLTESQKPDIFFDDDGYRDFLKATDIPFLVISGDHEIVFPPANWFDLVDTCPELHLIVLPEMGHGPQHQAPEFCADLIASFVSRIA